MTRSKVKSRSDHDAAHLHILTNVPNKYELLNLTFSEIQPYFFTPPAHPDTMGENNTPTALKGCGIKANKSLTEPVQYHTTKTKRVWCKAEKLGFL